MKLLATTLVAASLFTIGCNRDQQASSDQSLKTDQDSIKKSADAARKDIDAQAKAEKERVDAESKAAQSKIDAAKAETKADAANAQTRVESETKKIQDAAGSAGAKIESQAGQAKSTSDIDQKLTEQVQTTLKGDASDPTAAAQAPKDVQVTVLNGVVTLKGTVKTDAEKAALEQKIKAVPGVTKVDNQLTVKAE
jgi:hyperosmotically inducible protein